MLQRPNADRLSCRRSYDRKEQPGPQADNANVQTQPTVESVKIRQGILNVDQ